MARSRMASCRTGAKGSPNGWSKRCSTALVVLDSMNLGLVLMVNRRSEIVTTDYLRFDSGSALGSTRPSPDMEEQFDFFAIAIAAAARGLA